jgi:acid phosphatase (class A)
MSRHSFFASVGVLVCALALALGACRSRAAAKDTLPVDPAELHLDDIIAPPPSEDAATVNAELAELHRIEQRRTKAEVTAAQADEKQEDMFAFHTVLGEQFSAANLPLTAALSAEIHDEENAATSALKSEFRRPRPYQLDHTLHPVCGTTSQPNSYPSGHSTTGYLEAFALAEMIPEKRQEILGRAADFAYNRMVCGVHYPSDLVAGRETAYALFGALMATPEFRSQLAVARAEVRGKLGLQQDGTAVMHFEVKPR